MVLQDLPGERRRSSRRNGHSSDNGLKSMMPNLLPTLDSSMESHFSKDFSHSEMTTSTTAHTSGTSWNYSLRLGDLGDSDSSNNSEGDAMSSSVRRRVSGVKNSIKKAFTKMTKKPKENTRNNNSSSRKPRKLYGDKTARKKGLLDFEESFQRSYGDDVSVDSTIVGDPPTVCSAAPTAETEPSQEQDSEDQGSDDQESEPRRRRSRSRPSLIRKKSRTRSSESEEYDSSESGRQRRQRPSKGSTSTNTSGRNTREDLRRTRSSRRGGRSSGAGGSGKRMPPKSKSYDSSRAPPPLSKFGGERQMPSRSSSFAGREKQRTAASRNNSVTAQAAIPNPRPSSRRTSNKAEPRHSATGRRRSGDGSGKSMNRSRSLKHVDQADSEHSNHKMTNAFSRSKSFKHDGDNRRTKQAPSRAKSFDGTTDMHNFDNPPPRRRSISQRRDPNNNKRKSNSSSTRAPEVRCRHGEKLGECCYEQASSAATKATSATPLFSLDSHFGVAIETKFDEVSIDTASIGVNSTDKNESLSAFVVKGKSQSKKTNSGDEEERRRRSKSRSKSRSRSPSNRPRSRSRSQSQPRSQSQTRQGEVPEDAPSRKSKSHSRRPSNGSGRGRRTSLSIERDRSKSRSVSRSRRPSVSERGRRTSLHQERDRSQSRSRRPSTKRSSSKEQQRGRSKSASRVATQPQQRPSSQAKRRPSVRRKRSASRSRRETRESVSMNIKQYETLSKEDIQNSGNLANDRRPRSLSRSRSSKSKSGKGQDESLSDLINPKARASRSLSRTRSKGKELEGIGDYLKRQQPEKKPTEEDTNSQSTGSKTTESNEVTYATPSWMWNNSSTAGSSFQASSSLFRKDEVSGFGQMHEDSSKTNGILSYNQSYTSHSYDAGSEMSTPRGANSALAPENRIGKNNNSPPLMMTTHNLRSSLSNLPAPEAKAKNTYGMMTQMEQEEMRARMFTKAPARD